MLPVGAKIRVRATRQQCRRRIAPHGPRVLLGQATPRGARAGALTPRPAPCPPLCRPHALVRRRPFFLPFLCSLYAYGVLDEGFKWDLSVEEAIELGQRSIYHATFRDAASGGTVSGERSQRTPAGTGGPAGKSRGSARVMPPLRVDWAHSLHAPAWFWRATFPAPCSCPRPRRVQCTTSRRRAGPRCAARTWGSCTSSTTPSRNATPATLWTLWRREGSWRHGLPRRHRLCVHQLPAPLRSCAL